MGEGVIGTTDRPTYCAAAGPCWSRNYNYTPKACKNCQWNAGDTGDYRAAVDLIAEEVSHAE